MIISLFNRLCVQDKYCTANKHEYNCEAHGNLPERNYSPGRSHTFEVHVLQQERRIHLECRRARPVLLPRQADKRTRAL